MFTIPYGTIDHDKPSYLVYRGRLLPEWWDGLTIHAIKNRDVVPLMEFVRLLYTPYIADESEITIHKWNVHKPKLALLPQELFEMICWELSLYDLIRLSYCCKELKRRVQQLPQWRIWNWLFTRHLMEGVSFLEIFGRLPAVYEIASMLMGASYIEGGIQLWNWTMHEIVRIYVRVYNFENTDILLSLPALQRCALSEVHKDHIARIICYCKWFVKQHYSEPKLATFMFWIDGLNPWSLLEKAWFYRCLDLEPRSSNMRCALDSFGLERSRDQRTFHRCMIMAVLSSICGDEYDRDNNNVIEEVD